MTRLMCEVVEERKRQKQRMAALNAILQLREEIEPKMLALGSEVYSTSLGWDRQYRCFLIAGLVRQCRYEQHQGENTLGWQVRIFYPVPVILIFDLGKALFGAIRAGINAEWAPGSMR